MRHCVLGACVMAIWIPAALGGTEDLRLDSGVAFPKVYQGGVDPVFGNVYNFAPNGSDTGNYEIYASTTGGNSASQFSSKTADGGTAFNTHNFSFPTAGVPYGNHTVSVTLRDTDTNASVTQDHTVTVLRHPKVAIGVNGVSKPLPTTPPPAQEPSVDPLAFGATGGGESYAATSSAVADPPPSDPTGPMDLDGISFTGSDKITITLAPFSNLPADDDPAQGVPFEIRVDATEFGTFSTTFGLHYSDGDDFLPGAFSTGSEIGYFTVLVTVDATGVHGGVIVPEPACGGMFTVAAMAMAMGRRKRSS